MLDQLGNGLLLGIIIAMASVALSLLYGVTRIVNFAHGEIIALGAIMASYFSNPRTSRYIFFEDLSPIGLSFEISIVLAIFICGLFGALLEVLVFRPLRKNDFGNIAVLVITIGISIFLRHFFLIFASSKPQGYPLELQRREQYFIFDLTPRDAKLIVFGVIIMIIFGLFISFTKVGKQMRAVRDSNELANISGINSDNIILYTWILSSMLAGAAGIFQGMINDVRWNMGFLILLLVFAGTVLGGIGTSFGAMVGGFLIGIVVQVSVALPFMEGHSEAKNAIALSLMIFILLVRPQGIFGKKERIS